MYRIGLDLLSLMLLVYKSMGSEHDCCGMHVSIALLEKNLAIANRSCVSCAQYVVGIYSPK